MTELPPIIERLDALYLETTSGPWEFDEDIGELEGPTRSFTCDCGVAAEDQRWIAASRTLYYPLRAELLRLQGERDRTAERLVLYQQEVGTLRQVVGRVENERDALLEALKDVRDSDTLAYAKRKARSAIANVEGKGG